MQNEQENEFLGPQPNAGQAAGRTETPAGSGNAETDDAAGDNAVAVDAGPQPTVYLEPESNLFKVSRILVDLTFTVTEPATRLQFECTVAQSEAAAELRQTFYAQPEAAQTREAEFAFFCGYVRLVVKNVRGCGKFAPMDPMTGDDFASFMQAVGPEPEFAFATLSQFFEQYVRKTKPAEFFR